jgi:hypothetical protein
LHIIFIEIKGADFNFLKKDGTRSTDISNGMLQIQERFSYVKQYYGKFRDDALEMWRRVRNGEKPFQAVVGIPPQIDPLKDVTWSGAVIGGVETEETEIDVSKSRNNLEAYNSPVVRCETWQSFLRKVTRA